MSETSPAASAPSPSSPRHGCRRAAEGDFTRWQDDISQADRRVSRVHQADGDAAQPAVAGGLGHPAGLRQFRSALSPGCIPISARAMHRAGSAAAGRRRRHPHRGRSGCRRASGAGLRRHLHPGQAGQEAAYRQWEQKIAAAQSRAPGFQGYRFEQPIPGVQDDWLAILRFDSEEHLQGWLDSPVRNKLLKESEAFVEEVHARIVRTGFDQWFRTAASAAGGAAAGR